MSRLTSLFLLIAIIPANARALSPGEPVYVSERGHGEGDWAPAKYVGLRSDCLLLERLRPYPSKEPFLKVPAQIEDKEIAIGKEVHEALPGRRVESSGRLEIVSRVLAVQQICHEVQHAGGPFRLYVPPDSLFVAAEFERARGEKKRYAVGDKAYAREFHLNPERWTLRAIVAERDDCYETDSGRVLSGHYGEDEYLNQPGALYTVPSKLTRAVREGDLLDGFTRRADDASFTTLEGRVKGIAGDTLILESSSEDCYYDPVKIDDLREAPAPLSKEEFASLGPGDLVLERIDPACCCCAPYYAPRKVVSRRRSCYLSRRDSVEDSVEAHIASQLIPAEALAKGNSIRAEKN